MQIGWWTRHVHDWEETARVKIPAVTSFKVTKMEGPPELLREALAMMHDRTSLHLRCMTCGEVKSQVLDGWTDRPTAESK